MTMTRESSLAEAEDRLAAANAAVADLDSRLASGDGTVTGAELAGAEGEVRASMVLCAAATARARLAEQAAAAAAAEEAAQALFLAHDASAAQVTAALSEALKALDKLVAAAVAHNAGVAKHLAQLRVLGAGPSAGTPRFYAGRHLLDADPGSLVCGAARVSLQGVGPHQLLQVLAAQERATGTAPSTIAAFGG